MLCPRLGAWLSCSSYSMHLMLSPKPHTFVYMSISQTLLLISRPAYPATWWSWTMHADSLNQHLLSKLLPPLFFLLLMASTILPCSPCSQVLQIVWLYSSNSRKYHLIQCFNNKTEAYHGEIASPGHPAKLNLEPESPNPLYLFIPLFFYQILSILHSQGFSHLCIFTVSI